MSFTLGQGRFARWEEDELVWLLENEGIEVADTATPYDMALLAEEYFQGRPMPARPSRPSIAYTSTRSGIQYVSRPAGGRSGIRRRSVDNDGFGYYQDAPPAGDETTDAPPEDLPGFLRSISRGPEEDHPLDDQGEPVERIQYFERGYLEENNPLFDEDYVVEIDDEGEENDSRYEDDHDTLAYDPEAILNEFREPDRKLAQAYAKQHHPHRVGNEEYSVCGTNSGRHCFAKGPCGTKTCGDPNSELARYGPGVSLYFKHLKFLGVLFFVLSFLSSPQLFINIVSSELALPTFVGVLEATTISGIASQNIRYAIIEGENSTVVAQIGLQGLGGVNDTFFIPFFGCGGNSSESDFLGSFQLDQCEIDRSTLGMVYTIVDLIVVFAFVLAIQYLHYFEGREVRGIAKRHVAVEEYTVQVVKVPPSATEEDLADYFERLTGEHVAEVSIAQDNGPLIRLYMERGKVLNRLWKMAARVYNLKKRIVEADLYENARNERRSQGRRSNAARSTDRGANRVSLNLNRRSRRMNAKQRRRAAVKLTRALNDFDHVFASYEALNEVRQQLHSGEKALSAFVTFETQQGYLKCLDLFPATWASRKLNRDKQLYFRNKRLRVRTAPPPSTIIWENMEYKWWTSRFPRRIITVMATLLVLSISVVVSYLAQFARKQLHAELSDLTCSLPWNVTSFAELETAFENIQNGVPNDQLSLTPEEITLAYFECFCGSLTYAQAAEAVVRDSDPCHSFWVDKVPAVAWTSLASVVIALVNILVNLVLNAFANFEKHHSIVNMELSLSRRMFIALFVNTGLIIVLVNADFDWLRAVFPFIGDGVYKDFTPNWYSNVGVQILVIMLVNIFAPHLFNVLSFLLHRYRRRTIKPLSQRELNEAYVGPVFVLNFRVAQNLMTSFVTMLYSPGMPFLYLIGAVAFFVYYWVDKFLLFKYYRTPPRYDGRLCRNATRTLTWAPLLHLAVAMWAYSSLGFFVLPEEQISAPDPDSPLSSVTSVLDSLIAVVPQTFRGFFQRLSVSNVVPLLIGFLVLLGMKILFSFTSRLGVENWYSECVAALSCGLFRGSKPKIIFMNPPLQEVRDLDLLGPMDSYSILRNPKYARAFAIDERFAKNHRHVASVQRLPSNQLPKLPLEITNFLNSR